VLKLFSNCYLRRDRMPFIQVRLCASIDDSQKNDLQEKLSNVVSAALSKPQAYIMSEITGGCSLYMNSKSLDNGAYIAISFLGKTAKVVCSDLTNKICDILSASLEIDPSQVYITYNPLELWGWNGIMF
jgi:phenylpyruvate tautomerase PptA (4-oxalocrotonate tautomerase family)